MAAYNGYRDLLALLMALAFGVAGGWITASRIGWWAVLLGAGTALLVLLTVGGVASIKPRKRPPPPSPSAVEQARDLIQRAHAVENQVPGSAELVKALDDHQVLVSRADDHRHESLVEDLLSDMRVGARRLESAAKGERNQLAEDLDTWCRNMKITADGARKELEDG